MKLSELCPSLEERPGQEAMILDVKRAYLEKAQLLIEAGTGIGKSFAYLLPAMEWARDQGEKTVISTHTIALQEQLYTKEIPFLQERGGFDLQVVLLKGMSHYPCYRKEEEGESLAKADAESCTHHHCPHFARCPYFMRKREAEKADLIIVNHHLLLADLLADFSVLPEYDRLIIDEAHHLEEIATAYFSHEIHFPTLLGLTKEESFHATVQTLWRELGMPRRFLDLPFRATLEKALHDVKLLLPEVEETKKQRLLRIQESMKKMLEFPQDDLVCWSEEKSLSVAELDVASYLEKELFAKLSTVILCSATLTVSGDFTYVKERLGLKNAWERIYESPFSYETQALFVALADMPEPNSPGFTAIAGQLIGEAITQSQGGAFVLFTSHAMLRECALSLRAPLEKLGYPLLCQGEEERTLLLERFRTDGNAVLLGTDSFWEGVDVPGEALRLVILVRLPFKAPGDPLFEAKMEKVAKEGGSPFMHLALPQAVIKFKQGFGRLIRDKGDRGSVICLDSRVVQKSYGRFFQKSLPPCAKEAIPMAHLSHLLCAFYNQR